MLPATLRDSCMCLSLDSRALDFCRRMASLRVGENLLRLRRAERYSHSPGCLVLFFADARARGLRAPFGRCGCCSSSAGSFSVAAACSSSSAASPCRRAVRAVSCVCAACGHGQPWSRRRAGWRRTAHAAARRFSVWASTTPSSVPSSNVTGSVYRVISTRDVGQGCAFFQGFPFPVFPVPQNAKKIPASQGRKAPDLEIDVRYTSVTRPPGQKAK